MHCPIARRMGASCASAIHRELLNWMTVALSLAIKSPGTVLARQMSLVAIVTSAKMDSITLPVGRYVYRS